MPPDVWSLYTLMFKSRLFEEATAKLWQAGLISGELHDGTGEEAVIAGVVSQLQEGDAMALDHRGSAALVMRGIDPVLILRELLGCEDGLCGGKGGHMHLFSKPHLAASSGIIGSSGPAAAGFALSAQYLRPGAIAVALFGDGAMNQGMLLESMNLAAAWNLPVVFVCKDDGWAVATQSVVVTGGDLCARARGLSAVEVDGGDVTEVWEAARSAIERARSGQGPSFLRAHCVHLEGHLLGFQLIRAVRHPLREMPGIMIPMTQSFLHRKGAALGERLAGLKIVLGLTSAAQHDPRQDPAHDPVRRLRTTLSSDRSRLHELEDQAEKEMSWVIDSALKGVAA